MRVKEKRGKRRSSKRNSSRKSERLAKVFGKTAEDRIVGLKKPEGAPVINRC